MTLLMEGGHSRKVVWATSGKLCKGIKDYPQLSLLCLSHTLSLLFWTFSSSRLSAPSTLNDWLLLDSFKFRLTRDETLRLPQLLPVIYDPVYFLMTFPDLQTLFVCSFTCYGPPLLLGLKTLMARGGFQLVHHCFSNA